MIKKLEIMKLLNWKLALLLIVLLAGFLRFYNLGTNPPSLTWDEAAWGYNAYSLGVNGKDEFGRFLPHDYLESFGDFKPPMYAYLDAIPVKLLGLNEFSTRFPSALFGILTVFLTFFLVRRIFWRSKENESTQNTKYKILNTNALALTSALFLAISPWHIMLSRAAFEANVATFFLVLGVWGFLAAVQDRKWYLVISAISFAFSMYTFNTSRVVAPLLVILLLVAFRKKLLLIKKEAIVAFIVGLIIFLPTFKFLLSPQAGSRFQEVNIFSDITILKTANQEIANDNNSVFSKIIHNRRFVYSQEYLKHYFDNLSPSFLFIKGDGNPKFSTQDVGQMYIWDIVFFVGGVLLLVRKKEGNWWLIPLWLLLGIIPAATARETPHALRIETTLPMFQIFAAYGFVSFLTWVKKLDLRFKTYDLRRLSYVLILMSYVLLFLNFVYFYHNYLFHYPSQFSGEWQYGYKQSIDYVKSVENNYDYIQVSNVLGRPYIYYLFYTKTDPNYFRQTAVVKRDIFGFVDVESFGKYIFPQKFNYLLSSNKKVLYINASNSVPNNAKVLKRFYLLNGKEVLTAYTI